MKITIRLLMLFTTVILTSILFFGVSAAAELPRMNDAHCHLVNFTQGSDGLCTLLTDMDKAGVEHTVIFGLPVVKKWSYYDPVRPGYYEDDDDRVYYYSLTDAYVAQEYLSLSPEQQKRLYPFICGFNPTDKNAVEHIERIMTWYPGVFVGIGEILTRHDDLSRLTSDEQSRANHPALDPVYTYAADHDLPIWIHSNIGTVNNPNPIYGEEIKEVLDNHPDTRIVWCHAGYSRNLNITGHPEYIRDMLKQYPNLWVDLSWVLYDDVIAKDGVIGEAWADLIRDYPKRFLIGTDNIGNFSTYQKNIRKYDLLLADLDAQTGERIAYSNLYDLLPETVPLPTMKPF